MTRFADRERRSVARQVRAGWKAIVVDRKTKLWQVYADLTDTAKLIEGKQQS